MHTAMGELTRIKLDELERSGEESDVAQDVFNGLMVFLVAIDRQDLAKSLDRSMVLVVTAWVVDTFIAYLSEEGHSSMTVEELVDNVDFSVDDALLHEFRLLMDKNRFSALDESFVDVSPLRQEWYFLNTWELLSIIIDPRDYSEDDEDTAL